MKSDDIVETMGYCGLVCPLCHLADECDGCKSESSRCQKQLSDDGCYQYHCCRERGLNGCWECEDFCCGKGMFSESHDLRLRAFVQFIKQEGLRQLARYLIENEKRGIRYGLGRDYDGLESEEEVIQLLKTGIKRSD